MYINNIRLCFKQTTLHTRAHAYVRRHSPFGKIFAIRRFADRHAAATILQDLLLLLLLLLLGTSSEE
jgi:hypothetical protein